MKRLLLHVVLVFACISSSFGQQTFQVTPGTSLESVRDQVRSATTGMTGDITVLLKNGTYHLTAPLKLTDLDGGKNGFKVIWKAETPGQVFLSGGRTVTNWTLHDAAKNIYKADVGNINFRQIYVNQQKGIRARMPNRTDEMTGAPYYKSISANKTNKTLSVKSTDVKASWSNFHNIELVIYPSWYHTRFLLDTVTTVNTTSTISFIPPVSTNSGFLSSDYYYMNASYYFENCYDFLDAEGEWYLNTTEHVLYYKPRAGENMASVEVIIPTIETLVSIKGTSAAKVRNITFEGITFEHTNWTFPSYNGLVATQGLQPQGVVDSVKPPGGVRVDWGDSINFYKNTFTRLGANGILYYTGDKNCVVDYNTFEKLSGNGLVIDGYGRRSPSEAILCKGFKVTNNYFTRVGMDYTNSMGIIASMVQDLEIESNKITNVPYTGMQIGNQPGGYREYGVKNILIRYNDVSNFTRIHNDGGGIYTLGFHPNCLIKENYVHDWTRGAFDPAQANPSAGLYIDNYGKYQILDHNVIKGYIASPPTYNVFYQSTTPKEGVPLINNSTTDQCVIDGAGPGNRAKVCNVSVTPPPVPVLQSFANNTLTWSKVDGATGYLVWIGYDSPGGRYTKYVQVGDVNTYTVTGVTGPIWVAVQSYNGSVSCRLNSYSNEMGITPFNPIEDAYMRGGIYQDVNFGKKLDLQAGLLGDGANDKESYLKFDLSSIPKNVASAKVRVALHAFSSTATTTKQIKMQVIPNDWSENTITWASKLTPTSLVGTATLPDIGKWVEFDVTSQVNNSLASNKLLSLSLSTTEAFSSSFVSRDSAQVEVRPQLLYTIGCTPPAVPTIASFLSNQLKWNKVAGATGYIVCISRTASGAYTEFVNLGDVDSYTITGTGKVWAAVKSFKDDAACISSYSNEVGSPMLNPVEDVYVRGGTFQNQNFKSLLDLAVKKNGDTSGYYDRESYLKFNLATIPSTVTSAKVRLKLKTADATGQVVDMHVVPNNWSESTITWATKLSPTSLIGSVNLPAVDKWVEFDVTSQVNTALVSSKLLSVGLSNSVGHNYSAFYSNDNLSDTVRPQLVFTGCVAPPVPVIASFANSQLKWGKVAGASGYTVCISRTKSGGYTEFVNVGDVDTYTVSGSNRVWVAIKSLNGTNCASAYSKEVGPPILNPLEDVYVRGGTFKNQNFNSLLDLAVKKNGDTSGYYDRESYLKFDLASIPSTVTSAKVRLKLKAADATGQVIDMHVVPNNWSEYSITWATKLSPTSLIGSANLPAVDKWVEFDVTSQVNTALASSKLLSVGLSNSVGNNSSTFYSNDNVIDTVRPQLVFVSCVSPAVPTVTSFMSNVLKWNKVAGASGYRVSISRTASGAYTEFVNVGDVDTYTVTGTGRVWVAIQASNGCLSGYSNEVATPILTPMDDAYVRSGTYQTQNFGTSTDLEVRKNGSIDDFNRESYLKFNLATIPANVVSAKIRLKVKTYNVTGQVLNMHVMPTNWSESTITWATKLSPTSLIGSANLPAVGKWIEFDVTNQVNSALASNKLLSVGLLNSTLSQHAIFYSKNNTIDSVRPVLVFTTSSEVNIPALQTVGPNATIESISLKPMKDDLNLKVETFKVYPNPVSTRLNIAFYLKEPSFANFSLYNLTGTLVKTIKGNYGEGSQHLVLDVPTEFGTLVKGLYIYRFKTNTGIKSGKLILE